MTKGSGNGGDSSGGGVAAARDDSYYPLTVKMVGFGLSRSINASRSKIAPLAGAGGPPLAEVIVRFLQVMQKQGYVGEFEVNLE